MADSRNEPLVAPTVRRPSAANARLVAASSVPAHARHATPRDAEADPGAGVRRVVPLVMAALLVVLLVVSALLIARCDNPGTSAAVGEDVAQAPAEGDASGEAELVEPSGEGTAAESTAAEESEATSASSYAPDPADWRLTLVNHTHAVPDGWTVSTVTLLNGRQVDERVIGSLQQMVDELRALGYDPFVNSGYRSHEEQQAIWDQTVNNLLAQGYSQEAAEAETLLTVARPGYSEHELGLAADICSEQFWEPANEPIQTWLTEHGWEYGWIRRYPEGKEDITGVSNEPWHYRYIGVEAATDMHDKGILTLEEYLGAV